MYLVARQTLTRGPLVRDCNARMWTTMPVFFSHGRWCRERGRAQRRPSFFFFVCIKAQTWLHKKKNAAAGKHSGNSCLVKWLDARKRLWEVLVEHSGVEGSAGAANIIQVTHVSPTRNPDLTTVTRSILSLTRYCATSHACASSVPAAALSHAGCVHYR